MGCGELGILRRFLSREDLHWMQLCIWWFAFRQLDSSDTQTPYIGFVVVTTLFYDFW